MCFVSSDLMLFDLLLCAFYSLISVRILKSSIVSISHKNAEKETMVIDWLFIAIYNEKFLLFLLSFLHLSTGASGCTDWGGGVGGQLAWGDWTGVRGGSSLI
ncbi:hypothetical protein ES332_A09G017200v1 [Gossypium tomentosum]|uniref:Uncharacterized protein n=1 Tax=Gossypium tomentosum TaxID=34277 RepID=A0A5D2P039_GOSTO|nr:hypothetical protein ES332_A09G017200v1 [Gossypium tomentosum]